MHVPWSHTLRSKLLAAAGDIRWWLLLLAAVRLVGITAPPMEVGHAWRQCLTAMIARDMAVSGFDLFHPRVDMGGPDGAVIGAEFPVLNALMALAYRVLGPAHWYGRPLVLAITTLGLWHFHQILRMWYTGRMAFMATLMLATSIWFSFGRKMMPDTFSTALVIMGAHQALLYLRDGEAARLVSATMLLACGGLCKMPALTMAAALVVPVMQGFGSPARARRLALACMVPLALVVLWYFAWVPHLVRTYGYPLFFPRDILTGLTQLWARADGTANMFVFEAFRSYMGFVCCAAGLWVLFRKGLATERRIALLCGAVFLFFMTKAGDVFSEHGYYMVPFVPLMAWLAALWLQQLPRWMGMLLVAAVCIEGLGNQVYDLGVPARRRYLGDLERIADAHSLPGEPVVVNGGLDPQHMYFLHRRGWSLSPEELRDTVRMARCRAQGARRLFLLDTDLPIPAHRRVLYQDAHVRVVDLDEGP